MIRFVPRSPYKGASTVGKSDCTSVAFVCRLFAPSFARAWVQTDVKQLQLSVSTPVDGHKEIILAFFAITGPQLEPMLAVGVNKT